MSVFDKEEMEDMQKEADKHPIDIASLKFNDNIAHAMAPISLLFTAARLAGRQDLIDSSIVSLLLLIDDNFDEIYTRLKNIRILVAEVEKEKNNCGMVI